MTTLVTPPPPQDQDVEASALASALMSPDGFELGRPILGDGAAFYDPRHRMIWHAALLVVDAGKPLDWLAVANALGDNLESAGGKAYLLELPMQVASGANVEWYCRRAVELYRKREIIRLCDRVRETAFGAALDSAELLHQLGAGIEKLEGTQIDRAPTDIHDVIDATAEELCTGEPRFVTTGLRTLDNIGGLGLGELGIVAARPSVGKTSLGLCIAGNIARSGTARVAFYSVEMRQKQIGLSVISRYSGIPAYDLKRGKVGVDDIRRAQEATKEALPVGFLAVIDDLDIDRHIAGDAMRRQRTEGLHVAFVDFLQLCRSVETKETRNLEVAAMVGTFKRLAQRTGLAVVLLSQLNRDPARAGRRPALADLRDSGSIEQDADYVWMLHRDERYEQWTQVLVEKNRQGARGELWLKYDAARFAFEDAPEWEWPHT